MSKDSLLAPVCLFTYNRTEETKKTIQALKNNFLSKESYLFIFSDGWKNDVEKHKILKLREYLATVTGFKNITIYESDSNKGLAKSIIDGVTMVLNNFDSVIVLEDDLITSKNFLNFMNRALRFYSKDINVFSISGYTLDLPSLKKTNSDFYFAYRASSWGWGTWNRSWEDIDWDIENFKEFKKSWILRKKFNRGGSDMYKMLKNQMSGKIDSWAIRWCYNQFLRNQYTVFPVKSKIYNIGIGEQATHTKKTNRFNTILDQSNETNFVFKKFENIDNKIIRDFRKKFSIVSRVKDKFF